MNEGKDKIIKVETSDNKKDQVYVDTRDHQAIQQSILLALLNRYCTMMFKQTKKFNTDSNEQSEDTKETKRGRRKQTILHYETTDFLRLNSIAFSSGEEINVNEYITKRTNEQYQCDIMSGVKEKTAKHRIQTYRRIEAVHFFMDILSENGYYFKIAEEKGNKQLRKMTKIDMIYYKGKSIDLTNDNVCDKIHDTMIDVVKGNAFGILEMNNKKVQNVLTSV